MISSVTTERLFTWQRGILFLVVLLFPIQTILFYQKSLVSTFSFYGQISLIPLLIGLWKILSIATTLPNYWDTGNLIYWDATD